MEKIVLIGHGSPKKDANNVEVMARLLHTTLHPGCSDGCVKVAYLQFVEPGIADAIAACVAEGAKRIILHPFFLYAGMHVTKDIPEIIASARSTYGDVEFVYTEPLGMHESLARIILERINSVRFPRPEDIERRSFDIISEEVDLSGLPEEQVPVVKRVIHATADFEFSHTLVFHPDGVRKGIEAIRAGKDILTDVEMVRTGINKGLLGRWGGKVICGIGTGTDEAAGREEASRKTRAERGIETALKEPHSVGIIAIGNAPTALLKVIELFAERPGKADLPLVVGLPVGFVKALESKVLLSGQQFQFITNLSRKGGTPAAVAVVNALLKMAAEG